MVSFQMSLKQKFKDAVYCAAINVTALFTGTQYPALHCERVDTKFGVAVRLTLREEADDNVLLVFLPRHYPNTITNEGIAAINDCKTQYYLTYKGKNATTNRPMLEMDV